MAGLFRTRRSKPRWRAAGRCAKAARAIVTSPRFGLPSALCRSSMRRASNACWRVPLGRADPADPRIATADRRALVGDDRQPRPEAPAVLTTAAGLAGADCNGPSDPAGRPHMGRVLFIFIPLPPPWDHIFERVFS